MFCVGHLPVDTAGLANEKARGCDYLAGVGAYPCRQVAGVRDVVGSAWHVLWVAPALFFSKFGEPKRAISDLWQLSYEFMHHTGAACAEAGYFVSVANPKRCRAGLFEPKTGVFRTG